MRVGISLLTLAPGDLGGSETYARALTKALAAHGAHEYSAFVPAHAADAADGPCAVMRISSGLICILLLRVP